MSAADAREELEEVIWRAGASAVHAEINQHLSATQVEYILSKADAYAEAVADEKAAGRERLEQATAERTGRAG